MSIYIRNQKAKIVHAYLEVEREKKSTQSSTRAKSYRGASKSTRILGRVFSDRGMEHRSRKIHGKGVEIPSLLGPREKGQYISNK